MAQALNKKATANADDEYTGDTFVKEEGLVNRGSCIDISLDLRKIDSLPSQQKRYEEGKSSLAQSVEPSAIKATAKPNVKP